MSSAQLVIPLIFVKYGVAPSGVPFSVARIDADQGSTLLCYEIATRVAKAQGCQPIPDKKGQFQGEPVRPGKALLGTDRFVSIIAADGVDTMRVVTPGDNASAVEARSIDVDGVGRLLVAPIGGPPVTSEAPDPARTVQLLDVDGRVVREAPVPGSGGK